ANIDALLRALWHGREPRAKLTRLARSLARDFSCCSVRMALQGPFAVIADSPAPDVVEALRGAGAYPVVETGWSDAPAALTSIEPEGVVAAEPCPDQTRADAVTAALDTHHIKGSGFYMPV